MLCQYQNPVFKVVRAEGTGTEPLLRLVSLMITSPIMISIYLLLRRHGSAVTIMISTTFVTFVLMVINSIIYQGYTPLVEELELFLKIPCGHYGSFESIELTLKISGFFVRLIVLYRPPGLYIVVL